MKLTKEDIEKMEVVGKCQGGDVYHVLTKGGFNMIIRKLDGGEMRVLGKGPHRALARHMAESVDKNIQWNDSLWKSEPDVLKKDDPAQGPQKVSMPQPEHPKDPMGNPVYQSNPQNHYDLAAFHSKKTGRYAATEQEARNHSDHLEQHLMQPHLAGQGTSDFQAMPPEYQQKRQQLQGMSGVLRNSLHDAAMMQLYHSDAALKHYQMSGLNPKQAMDEHKKQMNLHKELPHDAQPPFQEDALARAWNLANPAKRPPKGLGNFSE